MRGEMKKVATSEDEAVVAIPRTMCAEKRTKD